MNAGAVCLRAEGRVLSAEVDLNRCLSSSCNDLVASACTVSEVNGTVKVTSRFVIEPAPAGTCTEDCGSWLSRCETREPAAGDYTFTFGRARVPITFPLVAATRVFSDATVTACDPP